MLMLIAIGLLAMRIESVTGDIDNYLSRDQDVEAAALAGLEHRLTAVMRQIGNDDMAISPQEREAISEINDKLLDNLEHRIIEHIGRGHLGAINTPPPSHVGDS